MTFTHVADASEDDKFSEEDLGEIWNEDDLLEQEDDEDELWLEDEEKK